MKERYRERSLWLDGVPEPLEPRASLGGDTSCDVAIVGAGFTGLWSAYALATADPGLRIVVLEAEIAGYGASGRNAGVRRSTFSQSATERVKSPRRK